MTISVSIIMAIENSWPDDTLEIMCSEFEKQGRQLIEHMRDLCPDVKIELCSFSPLTGIEISHGN